VGSLREQGGARPAMSIDRGPGFVNGSGHLDPFEDGLHELQA
jgi:hypothetical protein